MCTAVRFVDDKGNLMFGRNLDWSSGYGESVIVTPWQYYWQPAFEGEDGGNAVIGVGIIAENTPLYFDCANEHGLAVAGLNFPGYAGYEPGPVNRMDGHEDYEITNIAAYEVPLWLTRNFSTVDEVKKALERPVFIINKPINDNHPVSMLHWIVADREQAIVIEYMHDGMHVHQDNINVLTNQPTFDYHIENLKNYMNVTPVHPKAEHWGDQTLTAWGPGTSMHGIPGDFSSPSRFIRVAYANSHYPVQVGEKANVTRLFRTLQYPAMIDGCAAMANGQFEKTIFTSGYSESTRTYYKNEYDDMTIKSYPLDDFDLESTDLQQK